MTILPHAGQQPRKPALAKTAKTVTAAVEVIGPSEARYLLRLNTHNRHVSQSRVATMARDMANNQWVMNGETIKISKTDVLLDGQHRLLAVVESKKQVPMMVVRGLEEVTQETVDIGLKRTFSDVLSLANESSTHELGACVRWSWFMENFGKPRQFGINPSIQELQTHLDAHPDLRQSLRVGQRAGKSVVRYVASIGGALHYHMGRLNFAQAGEFWDHLIEGDTGPGDPTHQLREVLLRDLSNPHRMEIEHRAALTIKAWNAWRDGRKVMTIGFRSGGKAPEPYPTLR